MKRVFILFVLIMGAPLARAQDIAGDWQGTLNTGMGELGSCCISRKLATGT
jgi:hypothetical protein